MDKTESGIAPPLAGVRILEFSGLGPTPFGSMLLADLGAEVLRIERYGATNPLGGKAQYDFIFRGRPSVALDLKSTKGRQLALDLASKADVVVEGYRPGTMERLGLGPEELTGSNGRLIYTRMSGWGQEGPLAGSAGHDINYLAMSGGLYPMGPHDGPPSPPLNLVGNFGGGGAFLAMGVLAALNERHRSGKGQIIDVAMIDGISVLLTQMAGWMQMGQWGAGRGGSLLDGSAYFYRCYATLDDRYIAVGALEKPFHDTFLAGIGIDPGRFDDYLNPASWETRAEQVSRLVAKRTRDDWIELFAGKDACVSPVLTIEEAVAHPANAARKLHATSKHSFQPSPAPRFSRTPAPPPEAIVSRPDVAKSLADWSVAADRISALIESGTVA